MAVLQRAALPVDQNGNAYIGGDQTTLNTNTTLQLVTGPSFLHTVNLTVPGTAWVISIYDGIGAVGTPITFGSATPGSFQLYSKFNTGMYIVTSGTTPGSVTITQSNQLTL